MAGSTDLRRVISLLLLLAIASGCATGGLVNVARQRDRALCFEHAYTDGDRLWLVYRVERINSRGDRVGIRDQAARVRIADLDPALLLPIDALPVQHLKPTQIETEGLTRVALVREGEVAGAVGDTESPSIRVVSAEEGDIGFDAERLPGAAAGSYLRATVLDQHRVAPWIIPIFPIALAWDALAVPFLAILAVPSFAGSK
jgi:hypothetical protein